MSVLNALTGRMGRTGLKLRKHSPEILLVTGIIASIGGAIMAGKATLETDKILEEAKQDVEKVNKAAEEHPEKITDEVKTKDLMTIKVQTGLKIVKSYLPAVALEFLAIGCVCKSHGILNKRNAGLTAAYTALAKSYELYRKRVVETQGENVDRTYKYGIKAEKVKTKVIDPETGKEKTKTVTQLNVPSDMSEYGVWFSSNTSSQFSSAPGYNLAFLKSRETYWNHILRTRGHVFLNEILIDLGMQDTQAGCVVGWIVDKHGDPVDGDGYIDFGIFDNSFFNSDEYNVVRDGAKLQGEIYLDFNVDGIIYDKI